MESSRERQRRFREKKKKEGYIQKTIWIRPVWWARIKRLLDELGGNE
jgi:hypothetical protein